MARWLRDRKAPPSLLDLNRMLVGAISVALVVIVCAGAFAVGALGLLKPTYGMTGVFSDANGVGKGSDVRMAGVSIGTVTGVHPDFQSGQVIVSWKINRGVHLGKQMSAELSLQNLLGGEFIRLSGPVTRPYLEQLPAKERRIPLARTRTTFTVNGVLGSAAEALQQLDVQTINQLLSELTGVFDATKNNLAPLLTNLETVARAVNQRDGDLRKLLANTERVSGALAAKNQQMGQLIDTAHGLLQELVKRRDQLSGILGAGSDAVTRLTNLISLEQTKLAAIINDLHVATAAAGRQLPQIDQGFAWAGPTFAGLATVANQGPWIDLVINGISPNVVCALTQQLGGRC